MPTSTSPIATIASPVRRGAVASVFPSHVRRSRASRSRRRSRCGWIAAWARRERTAPRPATSTRTRAGRRPRRRPSRAAQAPRGGARAARGAPRTDPSALERCLDERIHRLGERAATASDLSGVAAGATARAIARPRPRSIRSHQVHHRVDDSPGEVAADGADHDLADIFATGVAALIEHVNESTMISPNRISDVAIHGIEHALGGPYGTIGHERPLEGCRYAGCRACSVRLPHVR